MVQPIGTAQVYAVASLTVLIEHAQASAIHLSMRTTTDNSIFIVMPDDGCGFDLEITRSIYGLSNIQSRAQQCGMAESS